MKKSNFKIRDWQYCLIFIYLYVCEQYNKKLLAYCYRNTKNYVLPEFTDEEVITIYLYGIFKQYRTKKAIYYYAKEHLQEWFPKLPSYEAFVNRTNRLDYLFEVMALDISNNLYGKKEHFNLCYVMDSMPIIIAQSKRISKANVAKGFASKGYCASKGIYYYGVKLHLFGFKQTSSLPIPCIMNITPASEHDINFPRGFYHLLNDVTIFADKGYHNEKEQEELYKKQGVRVLTPTKKKKNKNLNLTQKIEAKYISKMKQCIESLFSWLIEKTDIQNASKVRSVRGIKTHIWGRITATLLLMIIQPFIRIISYN